MRRSTVSLTTRLRTWLFISTQPPIRERVRRLRGYDSALAADVP